MEGRELLKLDGLLEGTFLGRPNRFICEFSTEGQAHLAHVADPGRLVELLYPDNRILVRRAPDGTGRKTGWSLMAAMGERGWVLVNTSLHRRLAASILSDPEISPFGPISDLRAEVVHPWGRSRFDFLLKTSPSGSDLWVEVKGCTLVREMVALFPDAPTTRGTRHLGELTSIKAAGGSAAVMFLVFAEGCTHLEPNGSTDPAFSQALDLAEGSGVMIRAVELGFDGSSLLFRGEIPVKHPTRSGERTSPAEN